MKYEKTLTINLGQYESLKLGANDAPDFTTADKALLQELRRMNLPHISDNIKRSINIPRE